MKKEIGTLFALFRSAVLGEKVSDYDKNEAAEKSELLYKMAKHHDMAHLLDYAYKTNEISVQDESVSYKLIKQQAMAVMRCENLCFVLEKVSELFEKERLSFIPLKGAVIRKLYPENWMRTSCDIDVLVHEEDLDRAEKLLCEKLGYTSNGERNYHDISLFSETGVHIELHFNIKENMENVDSLLERVWDYAQPVADGSFEYKLMDEFLLFQHIAHMSYHVADGGCSVRYFLDLFLLKKKLEVDKKALSDMLCECGLEKFYEMSLKLANIWFSNAEHDEVTLSYQRYILNGGIYGTVMNKVAANNDKKKTSSYIAGRIFMPYEQLCITYPKLKKNKLLLPFYQVKRWCRILKNKGYAKASDEIKANNSVSEKNLNEYSKLFDELQLKK